MPLTQFALFISDVACSLAVDSSRKLGERLRRILDPKILNRKCNDTWWFTSRTTLIDEIGLEPGCSSFL